MSRTIIGEDYEINTSDSRCWAFTFKYNVGKPADVKYEDYLPIVNKLNDFGYVKALETENDTLGRLHIHGIVMLRKNFPRNRLRTPGYHMYLDEIHDETKWLEYIQKDKNGTNFKSSRSHDNTQYMF